MIGIELRVPAISTGPVQVQTIEAVNLLCRGASMDLHGGLLVAIVPGNIEGAYRSSRHLRHGRPRVASARNVLQQGLVKRRRRLVVLQVDHWFAFHFHDLRDIANLQAQIDGGRETSGQNDIGSLCRIESRCCHGQFIGARWKQIKKVATVPLGARGSRDQERRTLNRNSEVRNSRARTIGHSTSNLPGG